MAIIIHHSIHHSFIEILVVCCTSTVKLLMFSHIFFMYIHIFINFYRQLQFIFFFLIVEYLRNQNMNVFAVDWSNLAQSPCYPGAVWNSRFVGKCSAQLVERIRELGATDIHVIGFSLGEKCNFAN